jgi:hypothetical protein
MLFRGVPGYPVDRRDTSKLGVTPNMTTEEFRIVETEAEAKSHQVQAIVVPTLRLDEQIAPVLLKLAELAQRAEAVSIWRPFHSALALISHRAELEALSPKYKEAISLCHARMREPVGGGSSMDNAWFQGFSTALGTSALFQLQSTFQSAGEVLDRKAAYALAAISLYVAVLSMALTVVFGWLSLK